MFLIQYDFASLTFRGKVLWSSQNIHTLITLPPEIDYNQTEMGLPLVTSAVIDIRYICITSLKFIL
jgi:hypothetical protein